MAFEDIRILPMDHSTAHDLNAANDPFPAPGKLVPAFQNQEWTFEEILFKHPYEIKFPDDKLDVDAYIGKPDKIIYLAYDQDKCVGQIRLVKDWNRMAYVENIAVKQSHRARGIGKMLFAAGEKWALDQGLRGLMLEAQDDNLAACRFYLKQGMQLGGVDTLKQTFNPNIETTLYFYKKLD
ncbi:GCN5 family acetyltransferase [Paenibacillus yonginensis]|uniref:GCN5 family acetyltransferase n=1 Tax=Paenibacillus yonginensis TaxID=1462996 RepID=A0A1B1N2P8_9BACL|nr:GNAT family N-acetyltransferase [Paenibacillus yonginensis]ANS75679.1 GCN5 family acetyltransferase [Paenibacillus yonginensis]